MKIRSLLSVMSFLSTSLAMVGCGRDSATADININPTTLDEAAASLSQIDSLQKLNADDPVAAAVLEQLRPHLDRLNHLVARVEIKPGHVVSFFEPQPGLIRLSEVSPSGSQRVLQPGDMRDNSATAVYRRLANSAPPAALVQAEEREMAAAREGSKDRSEAQLPPDLSSSQPIHTASARDGVQTQQSALSNDGQWYASFGCAKSGDAKGCFPNWANGGWAQANTKTSFLNIAPYAGGTVQVRTQYEGTTVGNEPVFQGQWGFFSYHSAAYWDCCFICACGTQNYRIRNHRYDILNATGKSFHWTYSFKWSCGDTLSCDQSPY
jgi:hypothetical protein